MSPLSHLNSYKRLIKKPDNYEDTASTSCSSKSQTRPRSYGTPSVLGRIQGKFLVKHPSEASEQPARSTNIESIQMSAPKLVITFVNSLTAEKVSNFFIWLLYYDIVQMSESPSRLYRHIDSMELRGWIALGTFLTPNPRYGLDLVVFDSICDRLKLTRDHVQTLIVRLADPKEMEYTRIARVFQNAVEKHQVKEETYRAVQIILPEMKRLAAFLKPNPNSVFAEWHPMVNERLNDFLGMVNPLAIPLFCPIPEAINHIRDEKHRQLSYEFEIILEQRLVPLVPYGIIPTFSMSSTFPIDPSVIAPLMDEKVSDVENKSELSFALIKMWAELRRVRVQNLRLEAANRFFVRRNEELANEVSSFRVQKASLDKQMFTSIRMDDNQHLQSIPQMRLPSQEVQAPGQSRSPLGGPHTPTRAHIYNQRTMHSSHTPLGPFPCSPTNFCPGPGSGLSEEYQSVFESFDEKPLPLTLIDPATGDTAAIFDLKGFQTRYSVDVAIFQQENNSDNIRGTAALPIDSIISPSTLYTNERSTLPDQPGPGNSMTELNNRQIGKTTPILALATLPINTNSAKNAIMDIINRHSGPLDNKSVVRIRRCSRSVGNALDAFRWAGWNVKEEREEVPDISTNF